MNKHFVYLLAILLALISLILFSYKVFFLQFPLQPFDEEDAWEIEVRTSFTVTKTPTQVSLYIPRSGKIYSVIDEQFISNGFKVNIKEQGDNRQAIWLIKKSSGNQFLYYRTTIRNTLKNKRFIKQKAPKAITPNFEGVKFTAAKALLTELKKLSSKKNELIKHIITYLNNKLTNDNVAILLKKKSSVKDRLSVAVNLLAMNNLPARIANGYQLEHLVRKAKLRHWLEVYDQGSWQKYDPVSGESYIELKTIPWWYGQEKLVSVTGGKQVNNKISISLNKEPALLGAIWREQQENPVLHKLSLFGLPLETQSVYQALLTIPIGVFLLLIIKNIIGIKTLGTFTPVLIALAFREIPLVLGLFLFSLIVGLGLIIRFYLEYLKLSRTPRLTAVLIIVVFLIGIISMTSFRFGIYQGLSVTLFPMVILAMVIEKMSIVWEKRGPIDALQKGLGSLMVATFVYLVMDMEIIKHHVLMFPELLLILLSATIVLGRYSGPHLLDWFNSSFLISNKNN